MNRRRNSCGQGSRNVTNRDSAFGFLGVRSDGAGLSHHASKWFLGFLLIGGMVALGIAFRSKWLLPETIVAELPLSSALDGWASIQQPSDPEAQSEAVIKALLEFINAPDHVSRLNCMYEQVDAMPELIDYYGKRGNALPQRVVNPSVSAINLAGKEILLVSFVDQDARGWSAPFEWVRGSYRLHWEAMTGYGEISWQQFFQSRSAGKFIMRAKFFIPEEDYRPSSFSNEVVVLLSHPELEKPRTVVVRKDSEAYQQLTHYPRSQDIPAIVEIHWPVSSSQFPEVTRWQQRDWIR